MKITFIEPTPSPNTMMIHLDEHLKKGVRKTYTVEEANAAPLFIHTLLTIPGVKSVFHTANFVAVDRQLNADWTAILHEIDQRFHSHLGKKLHSSYWYEEKSFVDEARIFVQFFEGIPLQIRVKTSNQEKRVSLPDRFIDCISKINSTELLQKRTLKDFGVRYGEIDEIVHEIEQELDATYPAERLQKIVFQKTYEQDGLSKNREKNINIERKTNFTEQLCDEDWKVRYAALDQIKPTDENILLIKKALKDQNMQIRRLAVVYLGDIRTDETMELLYQALNDVSVSVRRTAADTLSDIGNPAATPAMIKALKDCSKLVRWRAARFLYDIGTEDAIPALLEACEESAFEVRLQVEMALERIQSGKIAAGTIWQQMARRRYEK